MIKPNDSIQTKRLQLLKPSVDDYIEIYNSYTSDKRITKYTTWETHETQEETKKFLENCINKWNEKLEYNYKIVLKSNNKIIGMVRLSFPENGNANIGYVIKYEQWNKGFATEIMQALISYLFNMLKVEQINSTCDIENKASERVMQKAGMKFQGILPNYVIHPNISIEPRDALNYAITKAEYFNNLKD